MLQLIETPSPTDIVCGPLAPDVTGAIEHACSGRDLTERQSEAVFGAVVRGEVEAACLAALLVALKMKGEAVAEIAGAALALRDAALPFPRPDYLFADTCGTGGDHANTINVSTAAAFVAAAAGLPIAKHGNRSISSKCGSADVLEALGVRTDLTAEQSRRVLDETGVCFLFAPQYHPGLRHAGPVRRAIKVRTMMNILGPALNPARPPVQIMGVAEPELIEPAAHVLARLGVHRALVVHGFGLDEIALHGPTQAVLVADGKLERMTIRPEDAGLAAAPLELLRGGDPKENAARLSATLEGRGGKAERDAVALNAGALLFVAGLAGSLHDGVTRAGELIDAGAALRAAGRHDRGPGCLRSCLIPTACWAPSWPTSAKRSRPARRPCRLRSCRPAPRPRPARCAPRSPNPARASSWRSSAPRPSRAPSGPTSTPAPSPAPIRRRRRGQRAHRQPLLRRLVRRPARGAPGGRNARPVQGLRAVALPGDRGQGATAPTRCC